MTPLRRCAETIANWSRRGRNADLTLEELQRLRGKHEGWLDEYSSQNADYLDMKAQIVMNILAINSVIAMRLALPSTTTHERQLAA